MERKAERRRVRRTRWAPLAALLLAVLVSCRDSTGPHGTLVATGAKSLFGTVGSTVVVTLHVANLDGSVARGVPISFQRSAGNGVASPATTVTDQSGTATTQWTLGTVAGTGSDGLVVTSGTLKLAALTATSFPDVPAALKVLGDSQPAFLSLPVPLKPSVTVVDRFGNTTPTPLTVVTFQVSTGGGSFSTGSNVSAGDLISTGEAGTVFALHDDWVLGGASAIQTVTATSHGLAPATITATATAPPLPSAADWTQVATQFAAIAVDAFQQAAAQSSVSASRGHTGSRVASLQRQQSRASAQLNLAPTFTTRYTCCSLFAAASNAYSGNVNVVNVAGQVTANLDAGGSGSISLSETITEAAAPPNQQCAGNCDLPFTSTQALKLPSPGLTVTAVLNVANGVVQAVQQLHLTGSVFFYTGAGGSLHSVSTDVTFGFGDYPQPPAVATGTFGVSLTGAPLPNVPSADRADLAAYPTLVPGWGSAVGMPGQDSFVGSQGTPPAAPAGLFWTWLICPGPQIVATGGDMLNVTVNATVAWPTIAPDYLPYPALRPFSPPPGGPIPMAPSALNLAAGQSTYLGGAGNPTDIDPNWGILGPLPLGARVPWNAIYEISYVVKATGQNAVYSLAYVCR